MAPTFRLANAVVPLRWWLLAGAVACALIWWGVLWPATGMAAPLLAHMPGAAPLALLMMALAVWGVAWRVPALRSAEAQAWQRAMADSALPTLLLDATVTVVVANRACGDLLGRPARQLVGVPLARLCHGVDFGPVSDSGTDISAQPRALELQLQGAGDAGRWLQLWVSPVRGVTGIAWLGHFIDIDARKQVETLHHEMLTSLHARSSRLRQALSHQEAHDALTGLPNRTTFESMLQHACQQARRDQERHALVYLDLDRFKIVNDVAGHDVGDRLLAQVADRLQATVGPNDSMARLGGDEFAVLLRQRALDEARHWAEALLKQLADAGFQWQGRQFDVAASAGIAAIAPDCHSVASVMARADIACYAAKRSGRNRVSVYHDEVGEARRHHREVLMVSELRSMLDSDRCVLHAQRIVSCTDPAEQRYEVLVRLLDLEGNVLPPTAFIPAAEHYDAMAVVDQWVFEHCLLRSGEQLAAHPAVTLHLNVSANSLNDEAFAGRMRGLLEASPVAATQVVLEITETALIDQLETAADIIGQLRALGCGVALDDFGIGLSSFNYLRTFPVDLVKIDGSFVSRMAHSEVDRHIVRAIHEVATAVGARTIAESVEDDVTLAMVQQMGIDYVQGFGLHRPEPWIQLLTELAELR